MMAKIHKVSSLFSITMANTSTIFKRPLHTINALRSTFHDKGNLLLEKDIKIKEPYNLFGSWLKSAKENKNVVEPSAMCLSTASKDGAPSARYVMLKEFNKIGFKFFTQYTSRKGKEMEENPKVALTFYWPQLSRVVEIEGVVEKLPPSDADHHFHERPYENQISSSSSNQSSVIEGRHVLTEKVKELMKKYPKGPVPRPPNWGGYIVKPHAIEFWQGQTDRLHDRIRFKKPSKGEIADGKFTHKGEDGWLYQRISP